MADRFDTMTAYRTIHEAGIEETAAMAITTAINDSLLDARDHLATKTDLDTVRIQITAAIETRFSEIATKIADGKAEIAKSQTDVMKAVVEGTRWNVGALVGVGALVVGAVKFL